MRWIKKWMNSFDGHDELYHHAKLGKDRTMRAGCRCENVVIFPPVCREAETCRYCFYSVAKNQHFALQRKNYELDPKMNGTFYDGHDELYHLCKVWGRSYNDRQLQVRKCGVFFVCHAPSPEHPAFEGVHSSNKHRVAVYCPISTRFPAFFSKDCSLRYATQFSFPLLGGATIFAKLRSKLRKSIKSAQKFVRTTSYRQLRDLK